MDNIENYYLQSGHIHVQAMALGLSLIEPGAMVLDVAEKVESFIRSKGAQPAFPVNISINEIAAHYSPYIDDDLFIPDNSIVKLDLGVAVNGYITDGARTKIFDKKFLKLKVTAEKALNNALRTVKDSVNVYEVGKIVEQTIKAEKLRPIINLTGHSLDQYSLHDGLSIPSFSKHKRSWNSKEVFHKNKAYAIEPFVTTGKGYVVDEPEETIFNTYGNGQNITLSAESKEMYKFIKKEFKGLPFTPRWIFNAGYSINKIEETFEELAEKGLIFGYSVLREVDNKPVAQAEDTILITKENKKIILTRSKKENFAK